MVKSIVEDTKKSADNLQPHGESILLLLLDRVLTGQLPTRRCG